MYIDNILHLNVIKNLTLLTGFQYDLMTIK